MSKIEWTEKTWNPVIGCKEVSPGCRECYAARMAYRLSFNPLTGKDYSGLTRKLANSRITWTGDARVIPDRFYEPLFTKKPTVFFVNSMSDLFHEQLDFHTIATLFGIMALCKRHTFQVLTKRPRRMVEFFSWAEKIAKIARAAHEFAWYHPDIFYPHPLEPKKDQKMKEPYHDVFPALYGNREFLPNVWLGISVENQDTYRERLPYLLQTEAAVRFLSCEPLLGPLDLLAAYVHDNSPHYLPGEFIEPIPALRKIDWVIAGGESGPGARPMHPLWIRKVRDACQALEVPFFFKQWGEWNIENDSNIHDAGHEVEHDGFSYMMRREGKKKAGFLLDTQEYKAMPTPKKPRYA